ncbi:Uncharacterised protein [Streptococcus gordonii]|jgi:hypothetical protein|nr:Uncharacterised protein [Streptococcus gordonii]
MRKKGKITQFLLFLAMIALSVFSIFPGAFTGNMMISGLSVKENGR